jgi:hypothetical protein
MSTLVAADIAPLKRGGEGNEKGGCITFSVGVFPYF